VCCHSIKVRKPKSKLRYDRQSVRQSLLVSSSCLGPKTRFILLPDSCRFVDVGYPSNEIMGLSFTIAAGPCQHSHFTLSDSRLTKPGWSDSRIYSPSNRVAQLYPQALGSLFIIHFDSQRYGGGIQPHLHAMWRPRQSQCYFPTSGLPPIS
jgi:hypothetical protein